HGLDDQICCTGGIWSTWTIMVIVAFRTQCLRSAVMFLLPMPCSASSASVLPLVRLSLVLIVLRGVIQPLLVRSLMPSSFHESCPHVYETSLLDTHSYSVSDFQIHNSARPTMVKFALVA
nr:hypothetical protein [Tanacetum cinerariifolium]